MHGTAPSMTATMAGFAAETTAAPETALAIMRLSLLDWLAVALAGRDEPVSRIVRDMAASEAGAAEAGVIGLEARLPARAAALVNGTTSHALDYDDTHFAHIGHASAAVVPAALAVAEKTGASGQAALTAALIGAEAACRIGVWLGRSHYEQGFHQTATSGALGATLAAARLMGFDVEKTSHALGLATTRASGLKAQFGTMGKPYHAGLAAANGVEAATLAAAGFVSRPDGLECAQGFAATHAAERNEGALNGLGERFLFEEVQHKFHACCHGTHAALEALIRARDAERLTPEDVTAIAITVHPRYLKVCNIPAPTTGLEAKFSYRMTAAMVLAGHDTAALSTFTDRACAEPALVALRDRVTVETDPAMPETAAAVRLGRHAGAPIETRFDIADPLPYEAREAKVRVKAASLLGPARAEKIWAAIGEMQASEAPFALDMFLTP